MNHLLFRSLGGASNGRFIPQTPGTRFSSDSRLPGREKEIADVRPLMFVLMLAVGAAACVATILALFAWTGAGL